MLLRFLILTMTWSLLTGSLCAQTRTLRISYAGTSGYNAPLWVTQEGDLFKKYGFNADLIMISGGTLNLQALLANELQFANLSGTLPVLAALRGADLTIIATSYGYMPYSFVVHKDIRSAGDLKGKRIAVSRLGGITELAARLAFEKLGLGPNDMTFLQGGPDAQRIMALRSGQVAATVFAPPVLFEVNSLGLKVLADLGSLGIKYPASVIVAKRSYLAQNRPQAKRFLMSFVEGLALYKQKTDFSVRVTQKYTKMNDPEQLSRTHHYYAANTALVPLTDSISVYNAAPEIKAGGRRAEEFYDNALVQELIDEGFIEKVAKGSR
ncbi:MAG: ABC transporter substrate-binding protein [Deltaproteobacteria bacterium]|nr:ABC transporter substrate-binding protein [Deltaproteobacteria bacterium]